MITLEHVTKAYYYRGHPKYVARDINAVFPAGKSIGLLGRNGAGKSTLLQIIAGSLNPDEGRVLVKGNISWPIGLTGCIHPELTGVQNVKFIARIYGVDTEELIDFVASFAELGINYHEPVRTYSSGMRARLNFGMSMGIRFDTYLIDEVTAVGDAGFKDKSRKVFEDRMSSAGLIMVSHSDRLLKSLCSAGAVLENGRLRYFENIDDALEMNTANMLGAGHKLALELQDE